MYDNEEFGGMEGTLKSLINADPNFGEILTLLTCCCCCCCCCCCRRFYCQSL